MLACRGWWGVAVLILSYGVSFTQNGANFAAAFQPAIDLLDDFTCQALALPTRDNNARGLFTARGMNAKFMTCSYAQFPGGYDVLTQCLINPEIEATILDLVDRDKCPIVRP